MINSKKSYGQILISTLFCLLALTSIQSVYADDAHELIKAAKSSDLEKVKGLLAQNTSLSATNKRGRTALIQAARSENINAYKIVDLLINAGADVNATDNDGNTALMLAAKNGNLIVIQILLGNGANTSLKNQNGNTAADFAEEKERHQITSLLRINSGAVVALGLLIDLRDKKLTIEGFQQAAKAALTRRGWDVTSVESNAVFGALQANNRIYKTRFTMLNENDLLIRFEYGFGAAKQNYLLNLKTDFIAAINK